MQFVLLLSALFLVLVTHAADVTFDCGSIPETCNNMCYHAFNFAYGQLVYDAATAPVKRERREAAGCIPKGRCVPPPTADRTTCDEFPFASTTGWYISTGAGTRCVSLSECRAQGGMLTAAYSQFGFASNTTLDVLVFGYDTDSWCADSGRPSDGDFQQSATPPPRRRSESLSGQSLKRYRLSTGREVTSLSRDLKVGEQVFVPDTWWEKHPQAVEEVVKRQDDSENDDCASDQEAMFKASLDVPKEDLGHYETVVGVVSE